MNLSCEPYAVPHWDLDEDGLPLLPVPEPVECQCCGEYASSLLPASWDPTLLVCAGCDPEIEPDCMCQRMDVDVYDNSACEKVA